MGLGIYVPCNCYKEGLCSEPPVDKDLIVYDEKDFLYDLNLEYKGNESIFHLFDLWEDNCCLHKGMKYFYAHLCTNNVISWFIDFLELLNLKFKLLLVALNNPDEFIDSNMAKDVLIELNKINSENDIKKLMEDYNISEYIEYYHAFYEIMENLKKGCVASIETGNPLFFV